MKFTVLLMAAGVGLAKAEDVLVLMKADGSLFTTYVLNPIDEIVQSRP